MDTKDKSDWNMIYKPWWKEEHYKNGYQLLYTPHIGQSILWETSGHLSFYKEGMYSSMEIDDVAFEEAEDDEENTIIFQIL